MKARTIIIGLWLLLASVDVIAILFFSDVFIKKPLQEMINKMFNSTGAGDLADNNYGK